MKPTAIPQRRGSCFRQSGHASVLLHGTEPALFLGRGYTGHEHLPWFGLINMNARLYDPALGRFLSPDPYVQAPWMTQNYNRYTYAMNNPLVYIDQDGEKWWHWLLGEFLTGGLLSFTVITTATTTIQAAAVIGMTLHSTVTPMEHTTIWVRGFTNTSLAGRRFHNSLMIDGGLFAGNFWQILSRWTWEFPQTILGNTYSHFRNMIGNVDRVDHFDGATFATNEDAGKRDGISIGNYINININDEITGNFDKRILSDPLYMHEYGHYIDSQIYGISYLLTIGIPSIISAAGDGDHSRYWTEMRANKRAKKYFKKYYGIDWNTAVSPYYWGTFEDNYPTY